MARKMLSFLSKEVRETLDKKYDEQRSVVIGLLNDAVNDAKSRPLDVIRHHAYISGASEVAHRLGLIDVGEARFFISLGESEEQYFDEEG
jgi:hypothetical protein